MTKGLKLKVVKIDGVAAHGRERRPGQLRHRRRPSGWSGRASSSPRRNRFFQFIKSAEGKKIIIDYGVVPADLL